ncbi:hypothetical protein F383_25612 [Gossypium arboreum]|uniref:Uncharacterized protein n=1 Tax=Gossypium arboreum TaxID=29729 RepID=A0A0B0P4H0_GOSAR|nr:hypothetical protein F383_25612 [Gossypium arboreum]
MALHIVEAVHPTHQLLVYYLFDLRFLLISKCTSHEYIIRYPLKI